jgi:hypothetical protein
VADMVRTFPVQVPGRETPLAIAAPADAGAATTIVSGIARSPAEPRRAERSSFASADGEQPRVWWYRRPSLSLNRKRASPAMASANTERHTGLERSQAWRTWIDPVTAAPAEAPIDAPMSDRSRSCAIESDRSVPYLPIVSDTSRRCLTVL